MHVLQNILDRYSHYDFIEILDIIESLWITVAYLDFTKINGIIIKDTIGINRNISTWKQRFTMAHELCHFLLNEKWASSWLYASSDIREKRADDFASRLLVPTKALKESWGNFQNIPTLSEMFWVPKKVIENRLTHLQNTWEL